MRRLIIASALAFALLSIGLVAPAHAGQITPVDTCPGGVCLAASSPGSPGGLVGVSDGTRSVSCGLVALPSGEAAQLNLVSPHPGQPGGWFFNPCMRGPGGVLGLQTPVWLAFLPGNAQVANPALLAQEAYRLLPIPLPRIGVNPPADQNELVHLPIWLWVASSGWGTRSASVSVPGETVRAAATPVAVVWSMGDGNTVTCHGPGTPFDPRRPLAAQHPTCAYTYQQSSAGEPNQRFTVTATTTWRVVWTATGRAAGSGVLPPITRSAQITLRVAQAEALN